METMAQNLDDDHKLPGVAKRFKAINSAPGPLRDREVNPGGDDRLPHFILCLDMVKKLYHQDDSHLPDPSVTLDFVFLLLYSTAGH